MSFACRTSSNEEYFTQEKHVTPVLSSSPPPNLYTHTRTHTHTHTHTHQLLSVASSTQSSRLPSTADTECSLEQSEDLPFDILDNLAEMEDGEESLRKGDEVTAPATTRPPPFSSGGKLKHTGYQYGRIPWGDADVTCLVNEKGTPKFCLPELCNKVCIHPPLSFPSLTDVLQL